MKWWTALRHCVYCGVCLVPGHVEPHGRDTATRDHLFPKSRNGRDTVDACAYCNEKKADRDLLDWMTSRSLADRRQAVKRLPGTQEPMKLSSLQTRYIAARRVARARERRLDDIAADQLD